MTAPAPKKKLWPRVAVGPLGNSAIFACMGDVPAGWTLEVPLPDAFKTFNDDYLAPQVEALKRGPGRPPKQAR